MKITFAQGGSGHRVIDLSLDSGGIEEDIKGLITEYKSTHWYQVGQADNHHAGC